MSNSQNKKKYENLELLFQDNDLLYMRSEITKLSSMANAPIVKKSNEQKSESDTPSIGSLDEGVLKSLQGLFDSSYSNGGYKATAEYGKSLFDSFASEEIVGVVNAEHEKQITGIIGEKIMKATGFVDYVQNNVEVPQPEESGKKGVVSVWKKAWSSIKSNLGILGSILGSVFTDIYNYFKKYPWLIAAGYAAWRLVKLYGRAWSKIFNWLKFIPGVSIVVDIALAIKNIYYIQKEIVNDDWNETMEAIGQTSFVVKDPGEPKEIKYPNAAVRLIGEAIRGLTAKLAFAFKVGAVATKCTYAGFKCSKVFDEILKQAEKEFLEGTRSAEDFAKFVTGHIKASRKIKVVCSEMIGLICNLSSAIFDLAAAAIGIGTVISLIGNMILVGIDMGVREGIISTCKNFEDYWSKRLMDFGTALKYSANFVNESDRKLSGDDSNDDWSFDEEIKTADKETVNQEEVSKSNSKASEEARKEIHESKAA